MEEALGADGHGFLEQHDALIGLVADELQGGEAAGRRHVEMLPAARGHDKAFCCGHVGVLPCGGMRINVGTMNINVHEPARPGSICLRTIRRARPRQRVRYENDESRTASKQPRPGTQTCGWAYASSGPTTSAVAVHQN